MPDRSIRIEVDGRRLEVPAGTMLASALAGAGVAAFRISLAGEPRWPLCGIGTCFECRVTVDGAPHVRACMTPCSDGMSVETGRPAAAPPVAATAPVRSVGCDVLVIGGGPAGLAAARAASEGTGKRVAVVDEGAGPGGQIWRTPQGALLPNRHARRVLDAALAAGVTWHARATVVAAAGPREMLVVDPGGAVHFTCEKLILATGARELFLPFPGWTLPGVMGAGGLQALVKGGYEVEGKRIVAAGSGPLLLAVAGLLRARGAELLCVAEQAPVSRLAALALRLGRHPAKLAQAVALEHRLLGVRRAFGAWPVGAEGDGRLRRVTLRAGDRLWTHDCDLLACSFGLVPNATLARHLGCELDGEAVRVQDDQRTSTPGVFAAGEVTGVRGVESALLEGRISGLVAAGRGGGEQRALVAARQRWRSFGTALGLAYQLAPGAVNLCAGAGETVVCRCEDVSLAAVGACHDARDAKLRTRCGMGACQGRICGDSLRRIFGWVPPAPRPPLTPVSIEILAQLAARAGCAPDEC